MFVSDINLGGKSRLRADFSKKEQNLAKLTKPLKANLTRKKEKRVEEVVRRSAILELAIKTLGWIIPRLQEEIKVMGGNSEIQPLTSKNMSSNGNYFC